MTTRTGAPHRPGDDGRARDPDPRRGAACRAHRSRSVSREEEGPAERNATLPQPKVVRDKLALTNEPLYQDDRSWGWPPFDEVMAADAIQRLMPDLEPLPLCVDPIGSLRQNTEAGRPSAGPAIETGTHIILLGSARPLLEAFQHATSELQRWLMADYGFTERGSQTFMGQGSRG